MEKVIAIFEMLLDNKNKKIEAIVEGNTLTYYEVNPDGSHSCVVNENGNGFVILEKNQNNDFEIGPYTIEKSHYSNPKQFLELVLSVLRFNDALVAQTGW